MIRADKDLAYMLQYENVAWYEKGTVKILDRRIYPTKVTFVTCTSYTEVVQAISDMVTQSAGPYLAAGMGMALAAYETKEMGESQALAFLKKASYALSHARPTTSIRMSIITEKCLEVGIRSITLGQNAAEAIFLHTLNEINMKYERINKTAKYLTDLLPNKGTILTQCFGETIVGLMLREIREANKDIKVFCAETRPYLQGARLTASVAVDQGFDVTVITDNMPAFVMQNKLVDVFTSAADAITCDGHVINKIGTFQIAILCKYFGLPYYATGAPDKGHKTIDSIHIEMRDPNFVLQCMGVRTAKEGIKGLYPAFDITPPDLINRIVTDRGIFIPEDINTYFNS